MKSMYFNRKSILTLGIILIALLGIFVFMSASTNAEAATIRIKYNGKIHKNKSKKLNVYYNSLKINDSSYKAIKVNKTYMVPYYKIFKNGMKATCSYNKKSKKLVITKDNYVLRMYVGKKKAYLNGKKVKLPAAPLSIKYVSKNKTYIHVPIYALTKYFNQSYSKNSSKIKIYEILKLNYDNKNVTYKGVEGNIYYNHKHYDLDTLPVIKLNGKMYGPAEEVFDKILNLKYDYNEETGDISITNEDTSIEIKAKVNSKEITLNDKKMTISSPVKLINLINDKNQTTPYVAVPLADILKQLNYTRSWNKKTLEYTIQSKIFFQWSKELSKEEVADTTLDYLYAMDSYYSYANNIGTIKFDIKGSQDSLLKNSTIKRDKDVITITIPTSKYNLDSNQFNNFGEIIKNIEVVNDNNTTTISINCESTLDYSYTLQNGILSLNILYTYTNDDGSVISYSMAIPKPSGVTISDVTNTDYYNSKKFCIYIKGNHVSYLNKNNIVLNNNAIKKVTVAKSGDKTRITVKTSSLRGYKIYEKGNKFLVKIGKPKNIYKNILVLDAGHGGHDPGAQNKGTNEKDLNYKIIYTYMKKYFSSNAPDIKVYWTRTTDTFITLANRAAFAKKVGADAFISLHMNSSPNSSANGTEVYYSVSNNSKGFSGITSKKMATFFRKKIVSDLGTKNRGTKSAAYYVLRHNTVPSILIELGFISGSSDYGRLTNSTFQKKAAKTIYNQIKAMFVKYPTGR